MIKSWSSSQPVVALSSGEADLYALIKAATQAKGLASQMLDFDMDVDTVVHTDSRHIDVQYPWIHENVYNKSISYRRLELVASRQAC